MRDFVAPYAGARCLWAGCNPYDPDEMHREFARAGGGENDHPKWSWSPPVYPPSSLVVLLPVSLLRYPAARDVWRVLDDVLLTCGLLIVAAFVPRKRRAWVLLLGIAVLASEPAALLFNIGQPSGVALGLAAIAALCLLHRRSVTAGWICLGLALALKPQVAGAVWIVLAWWPASRKPAIKAAMLAVALLLVGCVWLSLAPGARGWYSAMHAAVEGSLATGAVNDPSPANPGAYQFTNLQAVFATWIESRRIYNGLAYAIGGALLAAWIVLMRRVGSSRRAWMLSLAAMAAIALLPVYHREYDVALLMFSFPAMVSLVLARRLAGFAALACTAVLLVTPHLHHRWNDAVLQMRVAPSITSPHLRVLLFFRQQPVLLLALALIYLAALAALRRENAIATDVPV